MNKKIEELEKWVAELVNKVPKDGYDYGKDVARQILSHPDIAILSDNQELPVVLRNDGKYKNPYQMRDEYRGAGFKRIEGER